MIYVKDGVSITTHTLTSINLEEIDLSINISNFATKLEIGLELSSSNMTIEIFKMYGNKGTGAIEFLPCIVEGVIGRVNTYDATNITPSGELELDGNEIPADCSRLNSYLNGKFGIGSNGRSKLNTYINTKRKVIAFKEAIINTFLARCIIYNDKWVEIYGRTPCASPSNQVINYNVAFGVTMQDLNYYIYGLPYGTGSTGYTGSSSIIRARSTTTFTLGIDTGWGDAYWSIYGYVESISDIVFNENNFKFYKTIKYC